MIIFDASTLILLAKIELLSEIVEEIEIIISDFVQKECTKKQELFDAKLINELIKAKRIKVERIKQKQALKKLRRDFNIGEGEASSLLLAFKKRCILATDDGPTLKICKIFKVKFVTAIHFLIRASERKMLKKEIALEKLDKLKTFGRYEASLIEDAFKKIRKGN